MGVGSCREEMRVDGRDGMVRDIEGEQSRTLNEKPTFGISRSTELKSKNSSFCIYQNPDDRIK